MRRLEDDLGRLISEVRSHLSTDRWALIASESTATRVHAAAGLAHTCNLAEEIVFAHRRSAELVGRTLARSLFETWLISYYIHLGGWNALEAVAGAYRNALQQQKRHADQHDSQLAAARRRVQKRNRAIRRHNEHVRKGMAIDPARPLPLIAEIPSPPGVMIELDGNTWLKHVPSVPAAPLPLTKVVQRLRRLTREKGSEETFEAAYVLAYRGLSTLGAHANLFVLNSYLDDRGGRGNFLRIKDVSAAGPSFAEANLETAALLVAGLSAAVLGEHGECPAADDVLERMKERHGQR